MYDYCNLLLELHRMRTIIEREKRIKNTFAKMCSNCPKDIKAYGECVAKFMGEVAQL